MEKCELHFSPWLVNRDLYFGSSNAVTLAQNLGGVEDAKNLSC